jgi:O-antigen/teichoic acid export membrane protein
VHSLGSYWFGIWILVGSIVTQYQALDFGMTQTVVRFLSARRSKGDVEGAREVFSTAITAFLLFGLISFIVVLIVLAIISQTVADPDRRETLIWVVGLLGATGAMSFMTFVYEGSIVAYMRQDLSSLLQILRASSKILSMYFALTHGYGVVTFAIITIVTDTIYRILVWQLKLRIMPELKYSIRLVSWSCFKEMLSFGKFIFLNNLAKMSLMHSSVIVVSSLISVSATAIYSIAMNVINRLDMLIRFGFFITMPAFVDLSTSYPDYSMLRARFLMVTRVVSFGISLVGGGLIFLGQELLVAWIGPSYLEAYWPLAILMAAWMFDLTQVPAVQLMTALGKHKKFAYYELGVGIASLLGAMIMAVPFGIIGVAIGVGLPVAISAIALKSRNVCAEMEIPTARYVWEISKVMLGSLAVQVPVWAVAQWLPDMSLLELFVFGCVTYGPVALVVMFVIMPRDDQRYIVGLMPYRVRSPLRAILPYLRDKNET